MRLKQDSAPIPTIAGVYLATSPRKTRFCYTFGGFATGGTILSNAARLGLALSRERIAYSAREFYFALYDIRRVFGRHNEVCFDSCVRKQAEKARASLARS